MLILLKFYLMFCSYDTILLYYYLYQLPISTITDIIILSILPKITVITIYNISSSKLLKKLSSLIVSKLPLRSCNETWEEKTKNPSLPESSQTIVTAETQVIHQSRQFLSSHQPGKACPTYSCAGTNRHTDITLQVGRGLVI